MFQIYLIRSAETRRLGALEVCDHATSNTNDVQHTKFLLLSRIVLTCRRISMKYDQLNVGPSSPQHKRAITPNGNRVGNNHLCRSCSMDWCCDDQLASACSGCWTPTHRCPRNHYCPDCGPNRFSPSFTNSNLRICESRGTLRRNSRRTYLCNVCSSRI